MADSTAVVFGLFAVCATATSAEDLASAIALRVVILDPEGVPAKLPKDAVLRATSTEAPGDAESPGDVVDLPLQDATAAAKLAEGTWRLCLEATALWAACATAAPPGTEGVTTTHTLTAWPAASCGGGCASRQERSSPERWT